MKITIKRHELEVYPKDLEGKFNHKAATEACASLGDGWRLPTMNELLEMNDYKELLELKYYYWSSTYKTYYAWLWSFFYGDSFTGNKDDTYRVRPVRTIK